MHCVPFLLNGQHARIQKVLTEGVQLKSDVFFFCFFLFLFFLGGGGGEGGRIFAEGTEDPNTTKSGQSSVRQ